MGTGHIGGYIYKILLCVEWKLTNSTVHKFASTLESFLDDVQPFTWVVHLLEAFTRWWGMTGIPGKSV